MRDGLTVDRDTKTGCYGLASDRERSESRCTKCYVCSVRIEYFCTVCVGFLFGVPVVLICLDSSPGLVESIVTEQPKQCAVLLLLQM